MAIYIVLYLFFSLLCIGCDRVSYKSSIIKIKKIPVLWIFIIVFFTLFIGLRHEIGPDWFSYIGYLERAGQFSFHEVFTKKDPGYQLLNYFSYNLGLGIYGVNLICGFIFSLGIVYFSLTQERPYLALSVAFPYLIVVVGMGYSRQAVAISIVMMSIANLTRYRFKFAVLLLIVAATFHKSAVLLIPIFFIINNSNVVMKSVLGILVSGLVFLLLLESQLDTLIYNYVQSGRYDSQGAYIRLFMCLIPSLLFLYFRRRFAFSPLIDKYWNISALATIFCTIILLITNLTTAIDRIALYLLPIQISVFSSLPNVLGKRNFNIYMYVLIILFYYFVFLLVWMILSSHSNAWIPYVFFPFWYLSSG